MGGKVKGTAEERRAYFRNYYKANREQYRAHVRKRRGLPAPTRPSPEYCECCGRPAWLETRELAVDHDHITGRFRGWICFACNLGIGLLGDTIEGLEKALAYLRRA